MAKISNERTGEYLKEALRVLKAKGGELPSGELNQEIAKRLTLNEYETSINNSGQYRWITNFRFYSMGLVKAGWIDKSGRTWKLTASAKDFESLSPLQLFNFIVESYGKWDRNRKKDDQVAEIEIEENDEPEILMQIKPDDISFQDLIVGISSCKIQIPPFQRSFVWRPSDIKFLLDSIYRGYPIGSFIFWKTMRKLPRTRSVGNIAFESREIAEGTEISYVLDGQQRITSLFAAIKGAAIDTERYRFLFDLRSKKFLVGQQQDASPEELLAGDRERLQISIEAIFTNNRASYRQLCRQYGDNEKYAGTLDTLYDRFMSYRFSVIHVIDQELRGDEDRSEGVRQVVRMFSRINETGRKLTVVAKMVARCWGEGFDLHESLDEFYASKELEGIREETLLQAASAILNYRKARSRDILERTNIRKLEADWDSIIKSFHLAIEFVKTKLKVRNLDYLPFDVILVPLTYLFHKNHALNNEQTLRVEKWFWRACLSNRYDATVEARIEEDCLAFDELLEGKDPQFAFLIDWGELKNNLITQRYNLRNAFVKTVLALYSFADPKNLVDGRSVSFDGVFSGYYKHNLHHIFPQAYLRANQARQRDFFDSIVNIMFIPAITNNDICDKAPSLYFRNLQKENQDLEGILQHHYIPGLAQSGLLEDDFARFLDFRADQLVKVFRARTGIGSASEELFSSDPAKPISLLETRMRNFLHQTLKGGASDSYWKECIPPDIQEAVNKKLGEEMKRHPYGQSEFDRDEVRIQFLDVMDYAKVILFNWEVLGTHFGSKGEVEKHFLAFKNYRNPVKHGRSLNEVDKRNGEAAVLWLENVLGHAQETSGVA